MTEQRRPTSRMVPALAAALVGVLLGALVVLTGVLAGQRGGCCCCSGPVCGERGLAAPTTSPSLTPGQPYLLPPPVIVPPWVRPELQRHDVPLPVSLALMGAGLLAWRMS